MNTRKSLWKGSSHHLEAAQTLSAPNPPFQDAEFHRITSNLSSGQLSHGGKTTPCKSEPLPELPAPEPGDPGDSGINPADLGMLQRIWGYFQGFWGCSRGFGDASRAFLNAPDDSGMPPRDLGILQEFCGCLQGFWGCSRDFEDTTEDLGMHCHLPPGRLSMVLLSSTKPRHKIPFPEQIPSPDFLEPSKGVK